MLEQEMKNLEKMNADNTNNHAARTRAEATIEKLQEKIRQVGGEVSANLKKNNAFAQRKRTQEKF